ncbi:MAG: hypothetical protein D6678_07080 [Zetaproteobacteria bacterium]|nr:MAG: hypothetical protein D6678_07080 [Zetaproteobacteria bacterium]
MRLLTYLIGLMAWMVSAQAAEFGREEAPLFPVRPVLADKHADLVYPSVAGEFLVYSRKQYHEYSVVRTSKRAPSLSGEVLRPHYIGEAIRFGTATANGDIGYVSSRLGPISAWMKQAKGDGHVAIANMLTFRGALAPHHLHASPDGRFWVFDSTMEKNRYNQLLNEFSKVPHIELFGQDWRIYNSNLYHWKVGYAATKTGQTQKFKQPALFLFDRRSSQLTMIPDAFDGAVSPDGKRIVFVRETNGNYDLWMQDVDGSDLIQLTHSPYADVEPAWSPDGRRLAFVSNRDRKGDPRGMSIYVLDLGSHAIQRVTNSRHAIDGGPTWKDAHTILFHSTRPAGGATWSIWQVSLR